MKKSNEAKAKLNMNINMHLIPNMNMTMTKTMTINMTMTVTMTMTLSMTMNMTMIMTTTMNMNMTMSMTIGCPTSSVAQANLTIKTNFNILRSFTSSDILTIYLHAFCNRSIHSRKTVFKVSRGISA
jgi:hypothetical protein